MTKLIVQKLK